MTVSTTRDEDGPQVSPVRLTLHEAHWRPRVLESAASLTGGTDSSILAAFTSASSRLRELLHLDTSPFSIGDSGAVRVDGIAGILRIAQGLELEVVPKYLDPSESDWPDDFFLLTLFSQTGRILPSETIRSGYGERGDLATLVARTMVRLYWENQRHPLRLYQRQKVARFAYDGDVDPGALVLPDADGFSQTVITLDRENDLNAAVFSAGRLLLPEVRDSQTRHQLMRMTQALAPQRLLSIARPKMLPTRHRHWQTLYDLAVQVLNGFGMSYQGEHCLAPGFVMRTWPTWQSLCEAALRAGMAGARVQGSPRYRLGSRRSGEFVVTPDAVLTLGGTPAAVVDAKYRTRDIRRPSIDSSDIYETLAFLRAVAARRAILLYPRPADGTTAQPVGTATIFDSVNVGDQRIIGMTLECRGISRSDGFGLFAAGLASGIATFLAE